MNTDYILNGGCEIRRSSKNIINNLRFSLILSNFAYERGKTIMEKENPCQRKTEHGLYLEWWNRTRIARIYTDLPFSFPFSPFRVRECF